MKTRLAIGAGALVVTAALIAVVATRDNPVVPSGRPLPASMAAIGDSITQAVAVDAEALGGAPERSWATGSLPDDAVVSHYERILEANPDISGHFFNNAVPGSTMANALEQAETTVGQRAEYVVILMGANDACTPNAASITPAPEFESAFVAAMDRLATGLPTTSIYVLSIPNVQHLWEVLHEDLKTSLVWANAGICQSMLSSQNTDADRAAVLARIVEFNSILERVCGRYPNCRFDQNALFEYEFSPEEVGPLDSFHPSEEGQARIADVSWDNGFWPEI